MDTQNIYEIRIQGHLSQNWAVLWFEGFSLRYEEMESVLTGLIVDQAALHGLIKRVRDLGIPLISVNRVESAEPESLDV